MNLNKKLLCDVKLKTGEVIPKDTVCVVTFDKTPIGVPFMNVITSTCIFKTSKFSIFYKMPSMKSLEKWSDEGICKSVSGHRVEPDGYGPDGSPSWLLALGMV